MTAPGGGTGIPILDELVRKAAALGLNVIDQANKMVDIMAPDTDAMQVAIDRLAAMTGGLNTTQQGLQQDGANAADGWSGNSAQAFGPHMSELNGGLANSGAGIAQVSGTLDTARKAMIGAKDAVMIATSGTVGALRVMGM
jgi:uncharacterized protein YukE